MLYLIIIKMKRTIVLFVACFISLSHALASNMLTVDNVSLRQGGVAAISINCNLETPFKGYQFDLELSGGLSLVLDANEKPVWENGFTDTDHTVSSSVVSEGKYRFVCISTSNTALPNSGVLLKLKVTGSESMPVGDINSATISNVEFTTLSTEVQALADASFNVNIVDPWIVLDETSTEVPENSDAGVKVKVRRTINANKWSTLCLPFSMTEAQVKTAFGEDVQLAEYIEHEMNNDKTELTVTFDDAILSEDGFKANYPYIIKTSAQITEFSVDGVTIDCDENGTIAEYTNGRTGSRKEVYGTFRGTYHAQTVVPTNALFLSDNKFYYSTGSTQMKAFRAYFDLQDVLAFVESSNARINLRFKGETDAVRTVAVPERHSGVTYNLQGQRVEQPARGLYIRDGKKIMVR